MEWLSTWTPWHWLILGFVLLIAETVLPGVYLLWWGLAAIVVSGLMALIPALGLTVLSFVFAVLAVIFSVAWWTYQHGKDQADEEKTRLNQRDHMMLNARGTVAEINPNGIGRGRFGDTTWRIQGKHLSVGDTVQVRSAQGITLNVVKVE